MKFKNTVSEIIEKYTPPVLSVDKVIYAHKKLMAEIKTLTSDYSKMDERLIEFKQKVEEDSV